MKIAAAQLSRVSADQGTRVALEVQQLPLPLPMHTDEPVTIIARRPSFPSPTNLGNLFTRQIGTCPGTFRHIRQGQ
ncbi:hypothetical protein [Kitasatospora azatica]|uniref:hypothetical protein n=1 Tax=Kitasatospora azatica TaxID=58347 RepID=UPI0012F90DDF|nr:hypothetical protein [Kitasatospora azatica]